MNIIRNNIKAMAHLHFCSRLWCPMEDDGDYQVIKAHSEIIIGEENK